MFLGGTMTLKPRTSVVTVCPCASCSALKPSMWRPISNWPEFSNVDVRIFTNDPEPRRFEM